jgi:hypothetical protein
VSMIQRPIENARTSAVTLSSKNRDDLSMKHSIMIGDRITDLIVTVMALGAVATFAALGFWSRYNGLACRADS